MNVKNKILNSQYDSIPEDIDPRLRRLLSLTLVENDRRASSQELLRLYFIRERLNYLFQNGILNDENSYKTTPAAHISIEKL